VSSTSFSSIKISFISSIIISSLSGSTLLSDCFELFDSDPSFCLFGGLSISSSDLSPGVSSVYNIYWRICAVSISLSVGIMSCSSASTYLSHRSIPNNAILLGSLLNFLSASVSLI
jgi:hypothetical protein